MACEFLFVVKNNKHFSPQGPVNVGLLRVGNRYKKLRQLEKIDFSIYDEVVFISKSIGTVIAGWVQRTMGITVNNIYLTPLEETLPYMTKEDQIIVVVAGTKDKYIQAERLKEHCEKENIDLHLIEGVGHRLEIFGDMSKNIEILEEVVGLY